MNKLTHKTNWSETEVVHAEDMNRIESNTKENTEQLLDIEHEVSNNTNELNNLKKETNTKENQIAEAIKSSSLEGYGLKYLVRDDAEIITTWTDTTEKTINCPDDKLMYIISFQISSRFHKKNSGSLSKEEGILKTFNSNNILTSSYFNIRDFTDISNSSSDANWSPLTNFANIIFSSKLIMNSSNLKLTSYSNMYQSAIFDLSEGEYSIIEAKPISKITLRKAQVTYLLLDKSIGGIDYSDFN